MASDNIYIDDDDLYSFMISKGYLYYVEPVGTYIKCNWDYVYHIDDLIYKEFKDSYIGEEYNIYNNVISNSDLSSQIAQLCNKFWNNHHSDSYIGIYLLNSFRVVRQKSI